MDSRTKTAIGLGIAGILIVAPGVIFLFQQRLSNDDLGLAFKPLLQIPLTQLAQERSVTAELKIPENPQWRRIRHVMGEAPLLLAISEPPSREYLYCPDQWQIQLQVTALSGAVSLEQPYFPYGFSVLCSGNIGTQFRASAGTKLKVDVSAHDQRPLPSGNIILINNWYNAKDKIVGVMIDEDFRKMFAVTSIVGALLILSAAYVGFWRRQHRS